MALRAHHVQITLDRLSPRNVREMIAQVAADNALAAETVNALVDRASGVPLFVEELTRAVIESGNANASEGAIPVTLQDSLMARLDRLGAAKEILQVGAVIGGEFSYELLQAVHSSRNENLQQALHALADAELLYVRGIPPSATYQFKHALIRDAAYDVLLKSRRKDLHRLIAQTISEKFQALKAAQPEVLARHWAEAGEAEAAIAEWSRAGKVAKARGAFKEALESYRQGLAILEQIPESSERDLRELALRQTFLLMLWMTGGPFSHDTVEAVQRARGLAEKTGKLASLVLLMVAGGWSALLASRGIAAVQMLADQALELALREGSPGSLLMAHSLQVQTCLFRGDLTGAENHFAGTTELVDNPSIKQKYSLFGLFVVQDFYSGAINAWTLGRLDHARERYAKMIATTDANSPYQLAASRAYAADFLGTIRQYYEAETCATQALELSEKNQFAFLSAWSKRILGSLRVGMGCAIEGAKLIHEGLAGALEIGCAPRGYFNKTFLAAAQADEGAIDDALETIKQALEEDPDEALFLPITLTLRGELRVKRGQSEVAEADFREALACARRMGGKMLELRAAVSLARLLEEQERPHEARELLAEIYNWFTEGFETADLKEAKALLDELSR
jgi:tetratricopeptide (TPR) repeat protein